MTFSTSSLVECPRISEVHPVLMSLIRMFRWNREMVLNIESEFLSDDFERFLGDLALNNSIQENINILLSYVVTNLFLVVLRDWEGLEGFSLKGLLFFSVPIPSFCSYFFFCHREILLGYCFVVTKGREFMREEFSPLSC